MNTNTFILVKFSRHFMRTRRAFIPVAIALVELWPRGNIAKNKTTSYLIIPVNQMGGFLAFLRNRIPRIPKNQ